MYSKNYPDFVQTVVRVVSYAPYLVKGRLGQNGDQGSKNANNDTLECDVGQTECMSLRV